MKILLLGATGFIGTNLSINLAKQKNDLILLGRKFNKNFQNLFKNTLSENIFCEENININTDLSKFTKDVDVVYHLISTCVPANSNNDINKNIIDDLQITIKLLESMVKNKCKKIVFISSGGAIYGNSKEHEINEMSYTSPITAYGIQKLTIEKIIYLYSYLYGLDYRIIRLGNPYGRFQKPNTGQGLIPTLIDNALNNKTVTIYGDGTNERDYIYIDDAIDAILNISNNDTKYKLYNVGSGIGVSINSIINNVEKIMNKKIKIEYKNNRSSDVKNIHLNVKRYENEFGSPIKVSLYDGILNTIEYMKGDNNG